MLQRFLLITLTLCSLSATAQWQQTGSKVRYVNGLGIPTKDTAAGVAADSSQIVIRPADSSLYIKYKRTWVKVGSGGGGTIGGSGTTNYVPKFTAGTTIGNSQIFDNGTNVGIGTTSPTEKLDIRGASGVGLQIFETSTGNNNRLIINQVGNEARFTNTYTSGFGKFTWIAGGSERMRIDTVGNVGIGYTAPAAKLAVSGTALINTNTDNGVDALQVSGSAIATTLKVNTSGQTASISTYYNGGTGNNLWAGGGGLSSTSTSFSNSSFGKNALLNNTGGSNNTAIGNDALRSNTTGNFCTAIGDEALYSNTSGSPNDAFGLQALRSNTTGYRNVGFGSTSMYYNTTGYENIGVGHLSLFYNTTGYRNIAFGVFSGVYVSGGTQNQTSNTSIYIGYDTRSSANGNTNEMVFGDAAIGQGSNTVTLGNSSITKTFLRGNTMVNTTTDNGVDELQVNGSISGIGFKQSYVTKTGAYTATNDDYVIDCTSGTFTVTLPASSGRTGRILIIKNSGAGTITVDGNASETIDGAATYSLSVQYATVQIISDGTNWKIIAKF